MPKCNFNKVAKQSNFIEIALWHGCSPVYLLHIFGTPFPRNISGWLLLTFHIEKRTTVKYNSIETKQSKSYTRKLPKQT